MQVRKKNSRQRLFQTCETLSFSASAVNAYGRLKIQYLRWPTPNFRLADNPGVDIATSGLSQVDYGAENGAGKRWV